jgi:DNA-binding beta-propeller fold protein YncE
MAAALTAAPTRDAALRCSLCEKLSVDPRCLPCLHVYCAGCVRELKVADLPLMTVRCMTCDGEYPVPRRDLVSGFPRHFGVANAVSAATLAGAPATALRACSKQGHADQAATSWCKFCSVIVCDACRDEHDGSGHDVMPLPEAAKAARSSGAAQPGVGGEGPGVTTPASAKSLSVAPRCGTHPSDALDMVCDGRHCPTPGLICVRCGLIEHADKPPHRVRPVAEVAAAMSGELGASLAATADAHAKLLTLRAGVDAAKESVQAHHAAAASALATAFDSIVAAANARRAELAAELATHRDAKLKCLDLEARSIDVITGHIDAARVATEIARTACGDTELVAMHGQLSSRLAALQAECAAEVALRRTHTVLDFACASVGELCAAIAAAGSVGAHGLRAADVKLDPAAALPAALPWGQPVTLTLLVECGDPQRDPTVMMAAALAHITGSAQLVVGGQKYAGVRVAAGGAGGFTPAPSDQQCKAAVAVAAGPDGHVRVALTFPPLQRPAAAESAAVRVAISCRGEPVRGTPLLLALVPPATVLSCPMTIGESADDRSFSSCNGIAVHPTRGSVYVADGANNRVAVFGATTGALLYTLPLGGGRDEAPASYPCGLAVHPGTGELWVADNDNNRLQVPVAGAVVRMVCGVQRPFSIAFSADGDEVYVVEDGASSIAVLRTADGVETSRFGEGTLARATSVCVDGAGRVVVACYESGRLSVWDPTTQREVRAVTEAGTRWVGVAAAPRTGVLYAVAINRVGVAVIEPGSATISRRILTTPDGTTLNTLTAVAVYGDRLLVAWGKQGKPGRVHVLPL